MHVERQRTGPLSLEETPYEFAFAIADIRIDQLKAYGIIRRVEELQNWDEVDDHQDELAREYRFVCQRLGLAWPPLLRDNL